MEIKDKVINESNKWFERNKDIFESNHKTPHSIEIVGDFIEEQLNNYPNSIKRVLEIGSCFGYNMKYLSDRFGIEVYGVDASDEAIRYGEHKYINDNIFLKHMVSDELEFEDDFFDFIIIGFSLYVTPRSMVMKSLCEANRVLKQGGFLSVTDFDTPLRFRRENMHNREMPVFKEDYTRMFLAWGYSLIKKEMYSHMGNFFNPEIQERVSTQILYKEYFDDLYGKA